MTYHDRFRLFFSVSNAICTEQMLTFDQNALFNCHQYEGVLHESELKSRMNKIFSLKVITQKSRLKDASYNFLVFDNQNQRD